MTREIEQLGGQFISSSSRETVLYQASTYTHSLPSVMSILSDTVLHPQITRDELDIQRDAALWEVGEIKTKPDMILPELLHETAFANNTLGNPLLCPEDRLEAMTPDVIQGFMRTWYRPDRLVVAAAGVEHDALLELADRHFGSVKPVASTSSSTSASSPSAPRPSSASPSAPFSTSAPSSASVSSSSSSDPESFDYLSTAPARYTGGQLLIEDGEQEFTHVYVGYEGLSIHDEDIYALATLQVLLGGGGSFSAGASLPPLSLSLCVRMDPLLMQNVDVRAGGPGKGMYSRLYTSVLNQYHAVDFCSAFHHCYLDSGLFGLSISVHPSFLFRTPELIAQQLDAVTRPMGGGIGETELRRARNQLKSSLAMALESRMVQVEDLGVRPRSPSSRSLALEPRPDSRPLSPSLLPLGLFLSPLSHLLARPRPSLALAPPSRAPDDPPRPPARSAKSRSTTARSRCPRCRP